MKIDSLVHNLEQNTLKQATDTVNRLVNDITQPLHDLKQQSQSDTLKIQQSINEMSSLADRQRQIVSEQNQWLANNQPTFKATVGEKMGWIALGGLWALALMAVLVTAFVTYNAKKELQALQAEQLAVQQVLDTTPTEQKALSKLNILQGSTKNSVIIEINSKNAQIVEVKGKPTIVMELK